MKITFEALGRDIGHVANLFLPTLLSILLISALWLSFVKWLLHSVRSLVFSSATSNSHAAGRICAPVRAV